MANYFDKYDWESVIQMLPRQSYVINGYHKILSPNYPVFLDKYIELPLLQRLKGVGLLCGTDWTNLYRNRFYYSRLDHSIGVALIIWHFTQDMAQTIAGLLHDVSTPVFSHVQDFRFGDSETQTATEYHNAEILRNDKTLKLLLESDGLTLEQVENYHTYPIADNEIPQLSADRLEYMFPSGMVLEGKWTLDEIQEIYNDITILVNEDYLPELGFKTVEIAEKYCKNFCVTGHMLQLNENKLTLKLLSDIIQLALDEKLLSEEELMKLSEREVMEKLQNVGSDKFRSMFRTFRKMDAIEHTDEPLGDDYYCVDVKVKQRYINPLVKDGDGIVRLADVSEKAKMMIDDFLTFEDKKYGCVKLL